jgi:hypothetical protein
MIPLLHDVGLFRYDICHSRTNFTAMTVEFFLVGVTITTARIRTMLYDSPHAQDRSWAGIRRISHGPAIRHHQPLRPGLQLGRHRPEPSRNVDRRRSLLCAADGRLGFSGSVGSLSPLQLIESVSTARASLQQTSRSGLLRL